MLPLALFMAHERSKGKGSLWQPYLELLPDSPGCAWLMEPDELQQALQVAKRQVGKYLVTTLPWPEPCMSSRPSSTTTAFAAQHFCCCLAVVLLF